MGIFDLQEPVKFEHNRESAMKLIIDSLHPSDCVVSTTGTLVSNPILLFGEW